MAIVPLVLVAIIGMNMLGSSASTTFSFTRLGGSDRYETARTIAESTFATSPNVVLATGERFPDALAGGYAAGLGRVPILLTNSDQLAAAALTAMQNLKTKNVLILGGFNAVAQAVETNLQSRGYNTRRIAGTDRFDTAKQLAESGNNGVGTYNGGPTAIVASGDDAHFADALAASPVSYAKHFPTLLTNIDTLSGATQQGLTDLGIKNVFVPGGPAAVSDNVISQMQQMGIVVQRIAGQDRTETATRLASFEQGNFGFSKSHVNLARGDLFPDSLSGGPHAGEDGPSPILLTSGPNTLGNFTSTWLSQNAQPLNNGHIFGGVNAVSDAVKTQAENAVRGNSLPQCTTTTTAATLPITLPGQTTAAPTSTTACVPATTSTTSTSTTSTSTTTSTTSTTLPGFPTTTSTTTAGGTTTTTTPAACNPGPPPFCFPANPITGGGTTTTAAPTTTSTSTSTSTSTTSSTVP